MGNQQALVGEDMARIDKVFRIVVTIALTLLLMGPVIFFNTLLALGLKEDVIVLLSTLAFAAGLAGLTSSTRHEIFIGTAT